jgi:hypothetical protein
MVTELRDYRIREGQLDQFVTEWQREVRPLRAQHAFTVDRAWTVEGESRFIWLLSFDGSWDQFEAANEAYYASPEREGLVPDPARLIEASTHIRLQVAG